MGIEQDKIYLQIISEANSKGKELRSQTQLPNLPTKEDLEPYVGKIYAIDRSLIDEIRRHLDHHDQQPNNGFDHLIYVATLGTYVAELECNERGITDSQLKNEILQRTWRLGLLHDIERYLGYGQIHQIEGLKETRKILSNLNIKDPYLEDQVFLHDNINVQPRNNLAFDIPFFSIFAADHLNYGLEWEKDKWDFYKVKGIDPLKAVTDINFLYPLRDGSSIRQTQWGINVVLPYLNFGIGIAEHIKKTFGAISTK